jgi:hypothetical protein
MYKRSFLLLRCHTTDNNERTRLRFQSFENPRVLTTALLCTLLDMIDHEAVAALEPRLPGRE